MNKKMSLILLVVLTITLLISCGEKEPEKQIIRPVRYAQVYSTGGSRERTFTGVAQAGIESRLSFKVPGTVKTISVKVGDDVKIGQLLAQLDRNDYDLLVQQADAALSQAKSQSVNASSNYDRVRSLYESRSTSKSEYDGARAAKESADAAVRAAEKQLELAELQWKYTELKAPANGAIASVNVEVNENVGAGQPVVVLTAGSDIEVTLSIPEVLISKMKVGSKVTVSFDALPNKDFSATIVEVGVSATGAGTTYPVTVRLDEKDKAILPGMAANISCQFEATDERERFIVPSHTVLDDLESENQYVFIVEPIPDETGFGTIRKKVVTIGEMTSDGIEIFEGLIDGDLLVTAGVSRVSDGQKVKI
jgi:RND family efflux transporter MFP subunit